MFDQVGVLLGQVLNLLLIVEVLFLIDCLVLVLLIPVLNLRLKVHDFFFPLHPCHFYFLLVLLLVLLVLVLKTLNCLPVLRQALRVVLAHSTHLLFQLMHFLLKF